jgi:hypothetical protein
MFNFNFCRVYRHLPIWPFQLFRPLNNLNKIGSMLFLLNKVFSAVYQV